MFVQLKKITVIAVARARCVTELGLLGIRHHTFSN